ncbi:MAG: methylenetetrahydrofolate--tRNA-(uracil(54)-C(5))-methyltransferase (FADH(2)-oxidizing) TrmFO [Proteobacteria bacterium]|nr:methylenetetrahydrofolate--tRNA-(uracil(54)-C(5))-methyltransferase (FADH(2)-oxidizing) TrmFO [Pseudomonadota bacterium]
MKRKIAVIGAGLAGCEAVWLLSKNGIAVDLFEMKPNKYSPAHKLPYFSELVCSNSFKSMNKYNPSFMLKEEMEKLGSIVMESALKNKVPAGESLAVDRENFSKYITEKLLTLNNVKVIYKEVEDIPNEYDFIIIATGPLTSQSLANYLNKLFNNDFLYFYDAIAPIIDSDSIDKSKVFFASRYDKGGDDFLNIPLTKEQYYEFVNALKSAEKVTLRPFEKERYYEGCLPIEVLAERGEETLAYGPMKPVGFDENKIGFKPFAIVQLRREDKEGTAYNIVGFQTKLTIKEQERVFRMLPGLEKAIFLRYGSIHRNTFIDSPTYLLPTLNLKNMRNIFFAGQITGVEGYLESACSGIMAGFFLLCDLMSIEPQIPPRTTAIGALLSHLRTDVKPFQPSGIHLGLFDKKNMPKRIDKKLWIKKQEEEDFNNWFEWASKLVIF